MTYTIALDTTRAVSAGIDEIVKTLLEALVLVIIVVFVFLQGWRATLIPLCAVPVSLIGTFMLFPLFGFSINTLALFGLVLAIGLVVDDAIVVVEAAEHHMEHELSPRDATLRAMEEVSGPVIGIALVLAAVFLPTAFIPGITGRLYQQFALTVSISVILSAINALTLSPALCALLLKPRQPPRGLLGRFFAWFNRAFGRTTDRYVAASRVAICKGAMSMAMLAALAASAGLFGSRLPAGFLPEEDQGYLYGSLQLPYAASMERTGAAARKVEQALLSTPGVAHVTTVVGFNLLSTVNTTFNSFFFITLEPWDERHEPAEQYVAADHQCKAGGHPGRFRLLIPPGRDATSIRPPTRSARRRMLSRPWPSPVHAGSKPVPSSPTLSTRFPNQTRRSTATAVQPEWRIALFRASLKTRNASLRSSGSSAQFASTPSASKRSWMSRAGSSSLATRRMRWARSRT